LIDDDVVVLEALAMGLRDAGYDVRSASGAAAGLDLIAHGGIDIIITDLNMPGMSGAQLIAEARARWLHLPIVAISGMREGDGRTTSDAARALGADGMLQKPFRASDLDQIIQSVLQSRRNARQAR